MPRVLTVSGDALVTGNLDVSGNLNVSQTVNINTSNNNKTLKLTSSNADGPVATYYNTGNGGRTYQVGSTNSGSLAGIGFSIYDNSGNASRLLIDASGYVGIGTIEPQYKLDVSGDIKVSNDLYIKNLLSSGSNPINIKTSLGINDQNYIEFGSNYSKGGNAGKIAYNAYNETNYLDIVGGGSNETNRTVKIYDNLIVNSKVSAYEVTATDVYVKYLYGNGGTIYVTNPLTLWNKIIISDWNRGDFLTVGDGTNRYGIGQYVGGKMRIFASNWGNDYSVCISKPSNNYTDGINASFTDYVEVKNDGTYLNNRVKINGTNSIEFGAGISDKREFAGIIQYNFYGEYLGIVGAGTTGANRKVKIWDDLIVENSISCTSTISSYNVTATDVVVKYLYGNGGTINVQNPMTCNSTFTCDTIYVNSIICKNDSQAFIKFMKNNDNYTNQSGARPELNTSHCGIYTQGYSYQYGYKNGFLATYYDNNNWNPVYIMSDDRLKHHEANIINSLTVLRKLQPQTYDMTQEFYDASFMGTISGEYRHMAGFVAQKIRAIEEISYCCLGEEYDSSGNPTPLTIDYNTIFTHGIAATKELDIIIQQQQTQIVNLREELLTTKEELTLVKNALNNLLVEFGKNQI